MTVRSVVIYFFQAEDGIREAQESRGRGDVYKGQGIARVYGGREHVLGRPAREVAGGDNQARDDDAGHHARRRVHEGPEEGHHGACLLYTSDAADDLLCVDAGGRRIHKKQKTLSRDRSMGRLYHYISHS